MFLTIDYHVAKELFLFTSHSRLYKTRVEHNGAKKVLHQHTYSVKPPTLELSGVRDRVHT